jgi:hypothetical protein
MRETEGGKGWIRGRWGRERKRHGERKDGKRKKESESILKKN